MRTFHCSHCEHLVFFENVSCLNCGHALAFLPDQMNMVALQQHDDGLWRQGSAANEPGYRLCANYPGQDVCNWAIPAQDPGTLCLSCRLTHVIPDLSQAENKAAWCRLETAKRRLIYTILQMQLPLVSKWEDAQSGLEFQFLSDCVQANGDQSRVLTGHANGLITINVAEADDVYRERQRTLQHEPYRTLLGHFRHEIGHYYWDRLVQGRPRIEEFRRLFGDERADYQQALARHYEQGPPAHWEGTFISAYASTHPWEDWAESWAHLLHMIDALETAQSMGLSLRPRRQDEPSLSMQPQASLQAPQGFDQMLHAWFSLTYVLNNLTRGLGLADGYPFVLSAQVIEKLRFIAETMTTSSALARAA